MKLKRKPYTVVLMLPEYAADNYGEDIYRAFVMATTPKAGVAAARRELDKILADRDGVGLGDLVDAAVVVMYEGHHTDINRRSKAMRQQPYIVILQTPVHVDSDRPVYVYKITAADPEHAVLEARKDAFANAELSDDKADDNYCNPYDYLVIAVFVGHHLNVNPEA